MNFKERRELLYKNELDIKIERARQHHIESKPTGIQCFNLQ